MAKSKRQGESGKKGKTQPEGRQRKAPGSGGTGNYYHIELRSGEDFETFRTQDVGDPGHLQRVGGKRAGGGWSTVKWLVSKEDAHVEDGRLVGDTQEVRDLLKRLRSRPVHVRGDRFQARPRRRGADRSKATSTQSRARRQSSKKASSRR